MSGTQLDSLTDFMMANVPKRAMNNFDSVMDELAFTPAAKDLGLDQLF